MERGKGSDSPCLLLIYCSSGCVLYIHFNMVSVVLQERATRSKYKRIQQPVMHQVSFFLSPSICFRHDTTLHFEYTLLLFLSLCSPDTDKPSFIYILKHHSQKPNCFKNSHINVLNKIVNTFLTNHLSRTYFQTP